MKWKGRYRNMTRSSSRFLAAMAVVGAAIAASLVGGVGVGHASTSFDVQLTALIAAGSTDPVPEVSYGGKIGYELTVANTDTSNTTHVQVIVKVPTATFFDATDPSCAAAKGDPSTMICSPFGGTINANQTYTVDFRFTAPTSGTSVTATPSVSIAAKTQGNPGNNGTTVATGDPVSVELNADGSTNDTYLRHGENASAGGPQNFSAQLPTALLGDPFGLELGIHNQNGQACPTCIGTFTELTIPAASSAGLGSPFGATNPYGWTMSATTATSFKLLGVFHIDDGGGGTTTPIPACSSLTGGGPTLDDPVCYDTLTSKNKAGVQILTATGRGLENGKITFGA
jgi:uncharacterized protein DUF11